MHRVVVLALLLVAVASCGRNHTAGQLTTAPPATPMNDPALSSAASIVQLRLESAFASTYAGLEIRNDVPMLVIYRKPDPRLDLEAGKAAPNVRIEFRDARYTRLEMMEFVKRVTDDTEYWKGRGVKVAMAGPRVDGAGVDVGTADAPGDFEKLLRERYPTMSFQVRKSGEIVPAPYTGSVPVFPSR